MAQFPFAQKPAAPAETPVTDAAPAATEAPAVEAPAKKTKKTKTDKVRKTPAKQMTPEQVKQILGLVKENSYPEIAEKVGVTKFQVNRVLMSTKKQLRESAGGDPVKLAKVEQYITEHLSRPEDAQVGRGAGRGGKVKSALDDIVGDILASI
jgi:hypothetical protein